MLRSFPPPHSETQPACRQGCLLPIPVESRAASPRSFCHGVAPSSPGHSLDEHARTRKLSQLTCPLACRTCPDAPTAGDGGYLFKTYPRVIATGRIHRIVDWPPVPNRAHSYFRFYGANSERLGKSWKNRGTSKELSSPSPAAHRS